MIKHALCGLTSLVILFSSWKNIGCPLIGSTLNPGGEKPKSEKARLRKGLVLLCATPGRLSYHLEHTATFIVAWPPWARTWMAWDA